MKAGGPSNSPAADTPSSLQLLPKNPTIIQRDSQDKTREEDRVGLGR